MLNVSGREREWHGGRYRHRWGRRERSSSEVVEHAGRMMLRALRDGYDDATREILDDVARHGVVTGHRIG